VKAEVRSLPAGRQVRNTFLLQFRIQPSTFNLPPFLFTFAFSLQPSTFRLSSSLPHSAFRLPTSGSGFRRFLPGSAVSFPGYRLLATGYRLPANITLS